MSVLYDCQPPYAEYEGCAVCGANWDVLEQMLEAPASDAEYAEACLVIARCDSCRDHFETKALAEHMIETFHERKSQN